MTNMLRIPCQRLLAHHITALSQPSLSNFCSRLSSPTETKQARGVINWPFTPRTLANDLLLGVMVARGRMTLWGHHRQSAWVPDHKLVPPPRSTSSSHRESSKLISVLHNNCWTHISELVGWCACRVSCAIFVYCSS
jgi:hypothetical protein